MNIETVNELIQSLESAGELSIREQKFLKLAKAYQQLAAENVEMKQIIDSVTNLDNEPQCHDEGMGCGLEDRGITDRYEACYYGWNEAMERIYGEVIPCADELDFSATDRIVAGIKADGVEEFAKALDGAADVFGKSKALEAQENFLYFAGRGFAFAKQLREVAKHDN
ncbi:Uncharacterised protein [Klebsiella pneumoniae]|uniref:hypothetical protein n=1 Tax=Klebsiella pneumoniae TaxID=573 RepID=UPI002279590E|nr:hypothetical protein [Klebsiella pneumoniae]CAH1462881.1 Uncharacterised protein [Klebsiella pneumoniae]CAH1465733.1 Uncharacterised protein [Klebsiella pneumoniae]CAH1466976.1 Uncharacterised protein [Klebsiella pneumoniae]